ncbi:hypothetical protein M4I32_12510 [Microbacterium sp. LRZ72]|uniref:hypothetical protein n=1 Tax=Microbacterium sp. LRZ72 TaxID=2942481 RepID=UPI0029A72858|nr:hypothetical protein [Microbacterium sp. LRZ72]MDX2377623.1 hypothetical protein [Microbacterium sp. LRZ72]
MVMRRSFAVGAVLLAGLLLGACAAPSAPAEPVATPDATEAASDTSALTGEDIQEWVANAEWSFAPDGLLEPVTLAFAGGTASDDLMRTYEIGAGVESDANDDGIPDLAIPVSQTDGNGYLELWYIWLGRDVAGASDDAALADQVIYPIARTTRCGDIVHEVAPTDSGFSIDQTLWMPHTDQDRDCSDGGTGDQIRDITVAMLDDTAYPIQTAPIEAWGGVCPRSDWLDGIPDNAVDGRAAPPASAPAVIGAGENVALYELPEAPLLTTDGARFFGFQPEDLMSDSQEEADETPVRMHCAFAG